LAHRGIPFRLITKSEEPGEHSRAMVVQARTLEFYGQLGFADEMIEQGVKAEVAHPREGGDNSGERRLSDLHSCAAVARLSPGFIISKSEASATQNPESGGTMTNSECCVKRRIVLSRNTVKQAGFIRLLSSN
jgi:hypothetical protein